MERNLAWLVSGFGAVVAFVAVPVLTVWAVTTTPQPTHAQLMHSPAAYSQTAGSVGGHSSGQPLGARLNAKG